MIWVFVVSLPIMFINSPRLAGKGDDASPTVTILNFPSGWDIAGLILFYFGFLIETISDFQKFFFKENPANRGNWCQVGLWKYSRHPNYFGEMCLWWGIYLVGFSVYQDVEYYVSVLSPLFTMAILLFLSGLPLLEQSADKKYGARADYREYKKRVSPLIPLPQWVYSGLPQCTKISLFCEFPLYNRVNYENLSR